MYHFYTQEEVDYIREIVPGRKAKEVAEMFNERFGTNLTAEKIRAAKKRYKAKSGKVTLLRLLTPKEDEKLRAFVKGKSTAEIIDFIRENFGKTFTPTQVKGYKKNHKMPSGYDARFKKGNVPLNKGKKMSPEHYEKCKPWMWKKGGRPENSQPVGTEVHRLYDRNPYIWVKVAEPNVWKPKHRIVWEAANGPIPEGYVVIFADKDSSNCNLENLLLVSKSEHATMKVHNLRSDNPEVTKVGVTMAKLIRKMRELEKK